MPEIFVI